MKKYNNLYVYLQPRQNLLNAASRVGEASTSVLYTIGEETPQDKETQVIEERKTKKSYLYRKLNYCYENFYKVFFGKDKDDYGSDFDDKNNDSTINESLKFNDSKINDKYDDDDGIYEDVDVNDWNKLDVIHEESDSEYYRSLEYSNVKFKKPNNIDLEDILNNCEDYLKKDNPELHPKNITDKIYNFKKDFSNHDYANINFEVKKSKNDHLREQFFLSNNNKNNK